MSKRVVARTVHRGAELLCTVTEQVGGNSGNPIPADWTHVTKVDPEVDKKLPLLYPGYLAYSSVVSVGGSKDVTATNTETTFDLLEHGSTPAIHEPSAPEHVTDRTRDAATHLAIPEVLNGDVDSLIGKLGQGIEHLRGEQVPAQIESKLPDWLVRRYGTRLADVATSWILDEAVFEAYIIQNPDSAAAREAGVSEADLLTPEQARQRAVAAERRLGSEVIYLEYSGTYGGREATDILEEMSAAVNWPRIWYGGGLACAEDAAAVIEAGADAVVVGDVFHDIATEERSLCERAGDDLPPGADRSAIESWIETEVDVPETATARYLSTIPSVDDDVRLAEEFMAATIDYWLSLLAIEIDLAADADPTRQAIQSSVRSRLSLDTLTGFDGVEESYAIEVATALLSDRFGVSTDDPFPTHHLGVRFEEHESSE